jgi:ElaB/YqjD/DUF883 family membrane-anchored ribosome-binding protein
MATAKTIEDLVKNGKTADVGDIEAQLEQIREDIALLAKLVTEVSATNAEGYKLRAKKATSDAAEASFSMIDSARDEVLSMERDLENKIRDKPLQSVAIAAGVGFITAFLARR